MKKILGMPIAVFIIALVVVGGASAALLTNFGYFEKDVTVNDAVVSTGDASGDVSIAGGETALSDVVTLTSQTSVNVPLDIVNTVNPDEALSQVTVYQLQATGTSPRENRVHVNAADVGITTLSDLDTVEFNQYVDTGYVGHVDVLIDTDGDGTQDDALVFEYAKVDPAHCEETPYPTGNLNTFGTLGIVDDNAYAWLGSGDAGPGCVTNGNYYANSLADWKTGISANGKTISSTTSVLGLDFEIDSWISDTTVEIDTLKVNGVSVSEFELQPSTTLKYYVETEFPVTASGTYTISSTVMPN